MAVVLPTAFVQVRNVVIDSPLAAVLRMRASGHNQGSSNDGAGAAIAGRVGLAIFYFVFLHRDPFLGWNVSYIFIIYCFIITFGTISSLEAVLN